MVLDFVVKAFASAGSNSAIQRFFVDMPLVTKKICLIRQVQVQIIEAVRVLSYDISFGMSVDPDHVLQSFVLLDSTMFLSGRFQNVIASAVGQDQEGGLPWIFQYPEGIKCPYTRLPFFIQHSNTAAVTTNWHVTVFFEYLPITAQELAVAVLRRGRGATRD